MERTVSVVKLGVTIDEAAEISGIGRNTMRKLVEWGKLPVLKIGRKTIIIGRSGYSEQRTGRIYGISAFF